MYFFNKDKIIFQLTVEEGNMKNFSTKYFFIAFLLLTPAFTLAQVTLTLPTATGAPGTELLMPISVNDLTGLGISTYQFQINFDPAVINITGISTTSTLSAGGSANYNADMPGKFRIAWMRAGNSDGTPNPLAGSGTLINVRVKYMANGTTPVTYVATDGTFISRFATNTITAVNGTITASSTNNPPVFDPVPAKSVNEGDPLTFTVNAVDPEGATLTYTTGTLPTGASFNASTKTFSWTPTYDQSGNYTVEFRASDGNSTTSLFVSITVVNVNRPPTLSLNPTGPYSVNGGQQLLISAVGSDPDGNTLTYSFNSTPAATGATINSATGAFSWTPTSLQAGTYNVTFTVTDGSLSANTSSVITVVNSNVAPTLTLSPSSPFNVYATQALNIQLNGADANTGDVLTYSFTSTPSITGATINSSTGAFSWTPSLAQKGSYTVTFKVTDSGGLYATSVATINVNNATPTLVLNPTGPSFTVNEGSALNIQLNGSDLNTGDVLTYSFASTPAATGATINPSTGLFSWTPSTNQFGTYNVTFTVSDGTASANVAAVITVAKINIAPTLTLNPAGPYSINEGSQLNIALLGADVNSGTTLTYSFVSTPAATGATINSSTGAFSWTPVTNQYGTYNVTFTVSDGSLTASVSTVITVVKVNIAPTLALNPAGPFSVNEGSQLNIQLVGSDVNNNTTLTYFYSSVPAATGAVLNSSTGLFSWTPGYDQSGIYNFTFTVSDGQYSANVTAQITVVNVDLAPTFTLPLDHSITIAEATTSNNTVQFSATGAPGITYSMLPNTPALSWVSFNSTSATLTLTPSYGVSTAVPGGVYQITIRATSTNGLYTDFILSVTVTPTLRNPVWTGAGTSTLSSKAIKYNETFNFSYIAYDPDGHTITYSMQSITPTTSSAVFTNQSGFGGFGQLIFTPTALDQGQVYTIVIKATCSSGLFATTTTLLTVGVNTPPAFTNILTNQTVKVHNVPVAFTFQYGATDIDGDPYIFSLISGKGSMTSAGKYSWTPVAEDKGTTNTVQVRVSDANNFLVYSETSAILTVENFITGVQNSEEVPQNFVVSQNYPNPFNPSTTIQFGIPSASNVRAVVYNVLGAEVAVLINGNLPAGYHQFTFDASNLPSGLYLCRIQADNMTLVKKMILAK